MKKITQSQVQFANTMHKYFQEVPQSKIDQGEVLFHPDDGASAGCFSCHISKKHTGHNREKGEFSFSEGTAIYQKLVGDKVDSSKDPLHTPFPMGFLSDYHTRRPIDFRYPYLPRPYTPHFQTDFEMGYSPLIRENFFKRFLIPFRRGGWDERELRGFVFGTILSSYGNRLFGEYSPGAIESHFNSITDSAVNFCRERGFLRGLPVPERLPVPTKDNEYSLFTNILEEKAGAWPFGSKDWKKPHVEVLGEVLETVEKVAA